MNLLEQETQPAELSYREIPLTQGKVAIVDAADYEALAQFKWHVGKYKGFKSSYALRHAPTDNGKRYVVRMHRQILNAATDVHVDHRDGNGLNNRRDNLRAATPSQNQYNQKAHANNTAGFKGVSFDKRIGKWSARIQVSKRGLWIGYFGTSEEAGAAYIEAAKRLHGEFANW